MPSAGKTAQHADSLAWSRGGEAAWVKPQPFSNRPPRDLSSTGLSGMSGQRWTITMRRDAMDMIITEEERSCACVLFSMAPKWEFLPANERVWVTLFIAPLFTAHQPCARHWARSPSSLNSSEENREEAIRLSLSAIRALGKAEGPFNPDFGVQGRLS